LELISSVVWSRLRCLECGQALARTDGGAECLTCGARYPHTEHGSLDLRLRTPRVHPVDFTIGTPAPTEHSFESVPLDDNPAPEVDFSGLEVPRHLTRALLSHFPRARTRGSLMLDLGCGEAVHQEVCAHAGFEWVGVDYQARKAPILADAQCIPFEDETFEFVLCVTVLQYVQFPFVAMHEMFRVLKPKGILIGTTAFLEPSHGTSFYHASHVGIYSLLQQAGFNVQRIAPFADWPR